MLISGSASRILWGCQVRGMSGFPSDGPGFDSQHLHPAAIYHTPAMPQRLKPQSPVTSQVLGSRCRNTSRLVFDRSIDEDSKIFCRTHKELGFVDQTELGVQAIARASSNFRFPRVVRGCLTPVNLSCVTSRTRRVIPTSPSTSSSTSASA